MGNSCCQALERSSYSRCSDAVSVVDLPGMACFTYIRHAYAAMHPPGPLNSAASLLPLLLRWLCRRLRTLLQLPVQGQVAQQLQGLLGLGLGRGWGLGLG